MLDGFTLYVDDKRILIESQWNLNSLLDNRLL